MSLVSYNYLLIDFLNGIVDTSKLYSEIVSSDIITALDHINADIDTCDILFKSALTTIDETTLSGIVSSHDGVPSEVGVQKVDLPDELRDRSGKLRVHQTSRKIGLSTYWTGSGDDPTDINDTGGGEKFLLHHKVGDSSTMSVSCDFNIAKNETWLHEGLIMWKDCLGDSISLEMVGSATEITVTGTNTNYALYHGYMIIPAQGNGNVEIVSDLTSPTGGLIYMPNNDINETPTAFWDADFNSSTGLFENIQPNPYGMGRYNMFPFELTFSRFANKILLLQSGFMPLNCSDTDQLGQGMRLKFIGKTNTDTADHEWWSSATLVFHRDSSS